MRASNQHDDGILDEPKLASDPISLNSDDDLSNDDAADLEVGDSVDPYWWEKKSGSVSRRQTPTPREKRRRQREGGTYGRCTRYACSSTQARPTVR